MTTWVKLTLIVYGILMGAVTIAVGITFLVKSYGPTVGFGTFATLIAVAVPISFYVLTRE